MTDDELEAAVTAYEAAGKALASLLTELRATREELARLRSPATRTPSSRWYRNVTNGRMLTFHDQDSNDQPTEVIATVERRFYRDEWTWYTADGVTGVAKSEDAACVAAERALERALEVTAVAHGRAP